MVWRTGTGQSQRSEESTGADYGMRPGYRGPMGEQEENDDPGDPWKSRWSLSMLLKC